MKTQIDLNLESYIDERGLTHVLDMLSDICGEKAAHIDEMWQDRTLANNWRKAAWLLAQTANKASHIEL